MSKRNRITVAFEVYAVVYNDETLYDLYNGMEAPITIGYYSTIEKASAAIAEASKRRPEVLPYKHYDIEAIPVQ